MNTREKSGRVRIGIGGWTYEPWRGIFYPAGLPHARELAHAANAVDTIEINGTYYRLQKPENFATWRKAAPPGFVFAVKASRYCTNRRVLAEAGESVEKFLGQGLTELGDMLGPILWQFGPTKQFDPEDFGAFVTLLPAKRDGLALRHALEVRHESFRDPAFAAMAREAGAAIVFADSREHPCFAELTADFVYARLQDAREEEPTGYSPAEIDSWADTARTWASGGRPEGFAPISGAAAPTIPRDTFVFMINGAKVRAPAAAQALMARLRR